MGEKSISIRVPGSTANLGAGFDSLGLAVTRYLQMNAEESGSWQFEFASPHLEGLRASKEDNLIYQVALSTAKIAGRSLPACRVEVQSTLPLACGLGSSAAATIGGIELANQMLDLAFTTDDKLQLALAHESHGDNLGASLYGGFVITGPATGSERPFFKAAGVPDIEMVVMVPGESLKTTVARRILPDHLSFQNAIRGSSVANMMVAAILQNDWEQAGEMMAEDVFHQPYRLRLVPELKTAMEEARRAGAYGAALSGGGPSVIAFVPSGKGQQIADQWAERFPENEMVVCAPDPAGVQTKAPSTL